MLCLASTRRPPAWVRDSYCCGTTDSPRAVCRLKEGRRERGEEGRGPRERKGREGGSNNNEQGKGKKQSKGKLTHPVHYPIPRIGICIGNWHLGGSVVVVVIVL